MAKYGANESWVGSTRLTVGASIAHTSPDNAAMEGFFGRLKNEFSFHRNWRGVTMEEFAAILDACLRFHNEGRIKESLGWKSPMQYRRSLGLAA